MAEHMKAWQVAAPGKFLDQLALKTDAAQPTAKSLKAQDILVKVISAGINPADYKITEKMFAARAVLCYPKTLGMDLSGEVMAVGPGVTDTLVGDYVIGRLSPLQAPGSLSEYAVLQRGGYAKLSRDANLDFAAAAGTAALTAYQTIKPYVKRGDRVFINGGSGGTGTYGIQIAKLLGCQVTVTCSTSKIQLCKDLGADEIIDYKKTNVVEALLEGGSVYSLVVDNVSNAVSELYGNASSYLLPKGTYVVVGAGQTVTTIGLMLRPSFLGGGKNNIWPYVTTNSYEDLSQLAKWISEGKLTTAIDSTYEFADVPSAFENLKQGSAAGKIVIHVSSNGATSGSR